MKTKKNIYPLKVACDLALIILCFAELTGCIPEGIVSISFWVWLFVRAGILVLLDLRGPNADSTGRLAKISSFLWPWCIIFLHNQIIISIIIAAMILVEHRIYGKK